MDNVIPNSNRNTTGVGKGGSVADEMKFKLPTGSENDREKQKHNKNYGAPLALPHEMTNIIDRLGDVFVAVLEIKKIFNSVRKNPSIKQRQYEIIDEIFESLDKANSLIADVSAKLDDLTLKD